MKNYASLLSNEHKKGGIERPSVLTGQCLPQVDRSGLPVHLQAYPNTKGLIGVGVVG